MPTETSCSGEMYHKNTTSSFLDIKCEHSFKIKPLKCIFNAFNSSFSNFLTVYQNQYKTVMISYAWKTGHWKNVFHTALSLLVLGYIKLQGVTWSCEDDGPWKRHFYKSLITVSYSIRIHPQAKNQILEYIILVKYLYE